MPFCCGGPSLCVCVAMTMAKAATCSYFLSFFNATALLFFTLLNLFLWLPLMDADDLSFRLPEIFSAEVHITAHLVDRSQDYPPWLTVMEIHCDFKNKRAAIHVKEGFDKGKSFLRRYDLKKEYLVKYGEYGECLRSYLGEDMMPVPEVSVEGGLLQGQLEIRGQICDEWVVDKGTDMLQIFVEKEKQVPIKITEYTEIEGVVTPVLSFDLVNLQGKTSLEESEVFAIPGEYDHSSCTWHTGGFPYIYFFSTFLRV